MSPAPENSARRCPQCDAQLNNWIACDSCESLFDVDRPVTHFELFDLPQGFGIDHELLSRAYRKLARRVHPDRFADGSERDRELATRLSARLNEAFQTLRDPVRRADYLLTQLGGPTAAECREVPGSLLAEVMEIREKIEEAKSKGDSSSFEALHEAITARRDSTIHGIEALCAKLDGAPGETGRELRKLLNSMKYFDNLLSDLAGDPLSKSTVSVAP